MTVIILTTIRMTRTR